MKGKRNHWHAAITLGAFPDGPADKASACNAGGIGN